MHLMALRIKLLKDEEKNEVKHKHENIVVKLKGIKISTYATTKKDIKQMNIQKRITSDESERA